MTPTERARAALKKVGNNCIEDAPCHYYAKCLCAAQIAEIADHIRAAENDALERVASWLDKTRYSSALAKDVRAMKHEVK